uniref:Single-stranded DNA binding protein n=1 Tax=Nitzschia sp. (in: diatoms) TaxID=1884248 RepID=A0A5J6DUK0_9STRA|nr:hypothetical protein [Nitzschia sp. (in: diatoms)]QES95319.1 hypothetical protein [Nitzschia sp. (in: diatoms)]
MIKINSFSGVIKILEDSYHSLVTKDYKIIIAPAIIIYQKQCKQISIIIWKHLEYQKHLKDRFFVSNKYLLVEGYLTFRDKPIISNMPKQNKHLILIITKAYEIHKPL